MPAYILAPTALVALIAWAAIRINRGQQISDEHTDCDCRTAALANLIADGGEPLSRMARAGVAGAEAERLGSHTHSRSNRTGTGAL